MRAIDLQEALKSARELDEKLRARGWVKLGSGGFGSAYVKSNGSSVLKIFKRDTGYFHFYNFARKRPGRHLPAISGEISRFVFEDGDTDMFFVKLEALQPVAPSGTEPYGLHLLNEVLRLHEARFFESRDMCRRYVELAALAESWNVVTKARAVNRARQIIETDYYTTLCEMQAYRKTLRSNLNWDLHNKNVMKRGDTLVIIDPWFMESEFV